MKTERQLEAEAQAMHQAQQNYRNAWQVELQQRVATSAAEVAGIEREKTANDAAVLAGGWLHRYLA